MNYSKKTLLLALSFFLFTATFAQTSSKGFSFQGYAIDPDGKSMAGTEITVQFTLTPTITTTTFREEHRITTDGFGVFHAIIGNSSIAKNNEFSKLDFTKSGDDYSLKVEVMKTSGGSYTTISNEPMLSVPYARKAANGVPVGTIVAFGGEESKIPSGWLLCDGTSVPEADYPQLYAVIGTGWGGSGSSFNLPDTRGRFLRAVDGGEGNDPNTIDRTAVNTGGNTGDKVGTLQGDTLQRHQHLAAGETVDNNIDGSHEHTDQDLFLTTANSDGNTAIQSYSLGVNATGHFSSTRRDNGVVESDGSAHTHDFSVNTTYTGGDETRPTNVTVYYIIKY
jgi:microcystin-dependent protein